MTKQRFKRTLKGKTGDVFAVPLVDGSFGYAQAIAPVSSFAIDFALTSQRSNELEHGVTSVGSAIALMATWRTVVTGGHWCKVGTAALCVPADSCPNQKLLASGELVGVRHSSWGLLEEFLSAFHGQFPWNLYPAFNFDKYLLPGISRPTVARVLDALSLEIFRSNCSAREGAA